MNPFAKHYMRLRFEKRVEALKKAGIPVNQKTVYDESIQVGVPVPKFGKGKHKDRPQSDYAESKLSFAIEFVTSGVSRFVGAVFGSRSSNIFEDNSDSALSSAPRGDTVDVPLLPKEAIFEEKAIILGEDMPPMGRLMYLAFAALLFGPLLFCQFHEDVTFLMQLGVWAVFGGAGCWLALLAL